jgi:hypothetical protein
LIDEDDERVIRWDEKALFDGATLPSALFEDRYFRSVPVGCSRFSRCCHLIIDLGFISRDGTWARRLTPSPELGESFEYHISCDSREKSRLKGLDKLPVWVFP